MVRALMAAAILALCAFAATAETVAASRTIRSRTVITPPDLVLIEGTAEDGFSDIADVVGLEARVTLYQGRPIRKGDVGPPAVIERNQIVTLLFRRGGLLIKAEARALGRAGVGDRLRVMNISSRKTVTGIVSDDGWVVVGGEAAPRGRDDE